MPIYFSNSFGRTFGLASCWLMYLVCTCPLFGSSDWQCLFAHRNRVPNNAPPWHFGNLNQTVQYETARGAASQDGRESVREGEGVPLKRLGCFWWEERSVSDVMDTPFICFRLKDPVGLWVNVLSEGYDLVDHELEYLKLSIWTFLDSKRSSCTYWSEEAIDMTLLIRSYRYDPLDSKLSIGTHWSGAIDWNLLIWSYVKLSSLVYLNLCIWTYWSDMYLNLLIWSHVELSIDWNLLICKVIITSITFF